MAQRNYKVDINLNQNELLKARVENSATSPLTPKLGQIYFDTVKLQIGVCINIVGPVWSYGGDIINVIAGGGGIAVTVDVDGIATVSLDPATIVAAGSMSAADKAKLNNATESATASTLMLRDVDGNTIINKITINDTPINNTDGANKAYVDAVAQGLKVKNSVRVIGLSNSALSGLLTIDGVTLLANDRVLLTGQTTTTQDGIYLANAGAWTRALDFKIGDNVASAFMFVEEGTINADTGWTCTNNQTNDVVGTNDLIFTQFSATGTIIGGFGLTKTGNTIDVVAADNSITVNPDSIGVNLNATGAIQTTGTGLNVLVDTNTITKNGSNQLTIGNYVSKVATSAITIGDMAGAQIITHNFNTRNVSVTVYDASTFEEYIVTIVNTTVNTVTITANGSNINVIAVVIGNIGQPV
jgi:hypothetical protein